MLSNTWDFGGLNNPSANAEKILSYINEAGANSFTMLPIKWI
jgi:hypothetical protein